MENIKKNNKGITLIALIITIIVLLILAGVSISMLTGQNGILTKTELAKEEHILADIKEQLALASSEIAMNREYVTLKKLNEYADDDKYFKGYDVVATTEGNEVASVEKIYISEGQEKIIKLVVEDSESKTGIVLRATTDGEDEKIFVYNQISGTVSEVPEQVLGTGTNEEIAKEEIQTFEVPSTVDEIALMEEKTIFGDAKGNEVVVPGGFGISHESGISITEGIVIQDVKGNQFVWVPIGDELIRDDDMTVTLKLGRYESFELDEEQKDGATEIKYSDRGPYIEETKDNTTNKGNTIATDIEAFLEESEKNGGYYIARYEAGTVEEGKITSKESSTAIVSQTQLEAAAAAKAMYGEEDSVESDLINSYVWDTAIMYIQKFSGNETYSIRLSDIDAVNDEYCKIRNMSSGVYEWSTETSLESSYPCAVRGGRSTYSVPTMNRGRNNTSYSLEVYGSRATLVGLDTKTKN